MPDWYADMEVDIPQWVQYTACGIHYALVASGNCINLDPMGSTIAALCGLSGWACSLVDPLPVTQYGGNNVTSLNHFVGAYYPGDRVDRNRDGSVRDRDPWCYEREDLENLGYRFKNVGTPCDENTEGDCKHERSQMASFDKLATDPLYSQAYIVPSDAGAMYNGATCHLEENLVEGMQIPRATYLPVDSMADFWVRIFSRSSDLVSLGTALHAVQDAFEPHHGYVYLGRGHNEFEKWSRNMVEARADCQGGQAPCDSYLTDDLYSPGEVGGYLENWSDLNRALTEDVVALSATKAARWNKATGQLDPDNPTFSHAIRWGLTENDDIEHEALVNGWRDVLALGHNLAVASTVSVLRKAFLGYLSGWSDRHYCDLAHLSDESTWREIVPGPTAGDYFPALADAAGWYVFPQHGNGASRHPYYNDAGAHPTNRFVFRVPYHPTWGIDSITDQIEVTFSDRCDWHASEGDQLRLRTRLFDFASDALLPWVDFGWYAHPEVIRGGTVTIPAPQEPGQRLAMVEVELVQGGQLDGGPSQRLFAGGDAGEIWSYSDGSWSEEPSGTGEVIAGIWGAAGDDVFAATLQGHVLHFDGVVWTQMDVSNLLGFSDIWGAASDDVWAVGNWHGHAYHFDGQAWTMEYAPGPGDMGLYGVWGSASDDVYAVGFHGTVHHFDGAGWSVTYQGPEHVRLLGVWGSAPDDIYAVGDFGTIIHYDGSTWSRTGPEPDVSLNGVWAVDDQVFAVGDTGTILHFDGSLWTPMESGTSADLNAVWGASSNEVYAVGQQGTVLQWDGSAWRQIAGDGADLHAAWGDIQRCGPDMACCTPTRRYGFKVDRIAVDFHQEGRASQQPPDVIDILVGLGDWLRDGNVGYGYLFRDIGVVWDCAPGSPCDQGIQQDLDEAFGPQIEAGGFFENEQIFDAVHEAFLSNVADPSVCPALTAYVLAQAAQRQRPGQSMLENGLAETAAWWSLYSQGALGRAGARNGVLARQQALDFTRPLIGSRPARVGPDGVRTPGTRVLDMSGYPGFREPTAAELANPDAYRAYLDAKGTDVERHRAQRGTQVQIANVDGLLAILDTDRSGNPAAEEKIAELRQRLETIRLGIEADLDGDGDQVQDIVDACPADCALGMDEDWNGCIDTACGFWDEFDEVLGDGSSPWLARLVLGLHARRACWMEQRGKPRAAAGLLQAFEVLVRSFARCGWIDHAAANHLARYAANARDVLLGHFQRLECPGQEPPGDDGAGHGWGNGHGPGWEHGHGHGNGQGHGHGGDHGGGHGGGHGHGHVGTGTEND